MEYFFSDSQKVCILALFSLLSIYGVLLISMTWFMRNFYWNTFLHVLFIRCSLNLYNKNPEKVNEILHRIICVFTAAFLYNYVANTFNLYFIPLTKILTMGSIYEKELLYIVSMLTIPLSVSAISEELKFNYLGKPVSSSNGYSQCICKVSMHQEIPSE